MAALACARRITGAAARGYSSSSLTVGKLFKPSENSPDQLRFQPIKAVYLSKKSFYSTDSGKTSEVHNLIDAAIKKTPIVVYMKGKKNF